MNLQQWARATHRALASQPAAERHNLPTAAQVEKVLQMSVTTLIEALAAGDYLQIDALGRLWTEGRSPYRAVSNLETEPRDHEVSVRKVIRYRASRRLMAQLNAEPGRGAQEGE